MSANEIYNKNDAPRIPYLPPELWTMVIQLATLVPGGYDLELTTLAVGASAYRMNKDRLDAWKKALVTRRSLVRISKTWYILASPFLYEYIHLGRGKAVLPLLYGMERSKQRVNSNYTTRSIGWWTKRLDVNLRDCIDDPGAVMDALAGVMTHLPNLHVLTFSITGHRYKELLPSKVLGSVSCRESLRSVYFYTFRKCIPSVKNWNSFLMRHPYLESVNLRASSNVKLDFIQTIHNHALYPIGNDTDTLWQTDFPAVRIATHEVEFSSNVSFESHQFFTTYGPKLTTIQLCQGLQVSENDEAIKADLRQGFQWILDECHALEQINLLFYSWSMFTFSPTFPSNVATLVVRVIKGQISKKLVVCLFHKIFTSMKVQNPNLKTIQFVSRINVRALQTHSKVFAKGLWLMSEIGLVIKDDEGYIME